MISFVWTDPLPLYSGRGGTESFTIGHMRELNRRGIECRLLTYGHGNKDGRQAFPDIEFRTLKRLKEIEDLEDTIIYINIPHAINTIKPSYVLFHFPALNQHGTKNDYKKGIGKSKVIANSRYLRSYWADYLDIDETSISIVYPFADPVFETVKRRRPKSKITRVLYAGRLSPEKGIYTFLESLHHPIAAHKPLTEQGFSFTVLSAGNQTIHGVVIEQFLSHHPWIKLIDAKQNPSEMARLYAQHELVVVPSNNQYWSEAFGMNSVEAQHSGCRVVASNSGGLPETNCGELILFRADNSYALYQAIQKAAKLGPLTALGRKEAIKHFSLKESVDSLLRIVDKKALRRTVHG